MRVACLTLALAVLPCLPALAQDAPTPVAGGPVIISVSYSINAPVASESPEALDQADKDYRRALYARAAKECDDLLATIAAECRITDINVSTQVNSFPGQPTTLYVSSTVNTEVTLKVAP
ncbi:hypothetical protein [Tabrizicola sp.]|uniref:hypothetical protein n=1 Tax=Tabrizicola sp. TaxID=2005166 RepID=UPI00286C7683|nr:hypothetical protein [Tabrizicola sp.]